MGPEHRTVAAGLCPHCLRWLREQRTVPLRLSRCIEEANSAPDRQRLDSEYRSGTKFSLFKRNEDGSLGMVDESDNLDKPCYDYKGLSRSREFLEKFVESLQAVDYDVYQIDHEKQKRKRKK